MTVDTEKFEALRNEIIREQARMPTDSLDWNIYQGQLDLLERVHGTFIGKTIVPASQLTKPA